MKLEGPGQRLTFFVASPTTTTIGSAPRSSTEIVEYLGRNSTEA